MHKKGAPSFLGIIVVLMFAGLGTYLLASTHAATPVASIEAEAGSQAGVTQVNDSTASNSTAVKFGSGSSGGSAACPAYPSFPDANCTGPTGALTSVSGNLVIAAGQTVTGKDISGKVNIGAGGKLVNSRVRCVGESSWCVEMGSGSTLDSVEVGGGANGTTYNGAIGIWTGGPNNLITKTHIHYTSDGIRMDGGTTFSDSVIDNLIIDQFPGVHADGIQLTNATSPSIIRHDSIQGGTNDAVFVDFEGNVSSAPVTVTNCLLTSAVIRGNQSSYGVGGVSASTTSVTNNTFGTGWQVAGIEQISGLTASGNVKTDGSPVNIGAKF